MLAPRVYFADVHLPEPRAKFAQEEVRLGHREIDLARMSYVEAKGRFRQLLKYDCEFVSCATDRLTFIHVLDANCRSELPPQTEIIYRIRVDHNGPAAINLVPKPMIKGRLPFGIIGTW